MGQIIRPRTFTPKTLTVNDHTVGVKNNVISALGREKDDLSQKISLTPSLFHVEPKRLSNPVTPTADPTADPDALQQKADFLATNGIDSEGIKEKETNTAQKTKDSVLAEAQAEYDRSRATYGVQAQSLRDSGLNRSGYAAYVDRLVAEQKNAVNAQAQDNYIAAMQNAEENYIANEKTNQKLYNQWLESLGEKTTTYAVSNALTDEEALMQYALSLGATQAQAEEFAASAAVAAKAAADQIENTNMSSAVSNTVQLINGNPKITDDQILSYLKTQYPDFSEEQLRSAIQSGRSVATGIVNNWNTTESNQSTERKRTAIDSVLTYLAYNKNLTDPQLSSTLKNTIPGITDEEIAAAISTARGLYVEEESTGITVTESYPATSADYASLVETMGHDATIDYMRNSGTYDEKDITALENRYNALQDAVGKAEEEQHASLMETLPTVITAISEGDVESVGELYDSLKTLLPAETLTAYNAAQNDDERIMVFFNYAQSLYNSDKSAENAALLNAVGDARTMDELRMMKRGEGGNIFDLLNDIYSGEYSDGTDEAIEKQLSMAFENTSITDIYAQEISNPSVHFNFTCGEQKTWIELEIHSQNKYADELNSLYPSATDGTFGVTVDKEGRHLSVKVNGKWYWLKKEGATSYYDDLTDGDWEKLWEGLVRYTQYKQEQDSSSSWNGSRYAAIKSPEEPNPVEMAELEALRNAPVPLSQKGYQQKVEEIVKKDNHQTSWLTTNKISE